jgi:hypothetical protein
MSKARSDEARHMQQTKVRTASKRMVVFNKQHSDKVVLQGVVFHESF